MSSNGSSAPQQPPPVCLAVTKSANPPAGTPVTPGMEIQYTLAYTVSDSVVRQYAGHRNARTCHGGGS